MNQLISQNALTMTSQEISELVESRHDNVKRTIERLANSGAIQLPPMEEVRNHLGQAVSVYHQTRFTPAGLSWIAGRLA